MTPIFRISNEMNLTLRQKKHSDRPSQLLQQYHELPPTLSAASVPVIDFRSIILPHKNIICDLRNPKSINLSSVNSPAVPDLYFVVLNAGFLSWPVRIFFYCYQILAEGSHIPIKKQMNNYYS